LALHALYGEVETCAQDVCACLDASEDTNTRDLAEPVPKSTEGLYILIKSPPHRLYLHLLSRTEAGQVVVKRNIL